MQDDDSLINRLSSAESLISQTANDITLKVSKTELDTRVHDEDTLLRRQLPSTVHTGAARIASIKGNTVRWNQLERYGDFPDTVTITVSNCTATVADNVCTLVPSDSEALIRIGTQNVIAGHKYLARADIKGSIGGYTARIRALGGGDNYADLTTTTNWQTIWKIGSQDTTVSNNAYPRVVLATPDETLYIKNFMYFDLTLIFGEGNEPATIAEFEELFPEPYYSYDPGSLLSVNIKGMKTIGFNQWDEEWEVGGINPSSGNNASNTTGIRSKNFIPVLPNTEYNFSIHEKSANWIIVEYDASKTRTKYLTWGGTLTQKKRVTTSANGAYIRFMTNTVTATGTTYGTVYNDDICINISDPDRNGEYEPYAESTREFDLSGHFPTGLKKAGTVYDELDFENRKAITRIGVVDLGTLTWTYQSSSQTTFFRATIPDIAFSKSASTPGNVICHQYEAVSSSTVLDKSVSVSANAHYVYIQDSAYTDAATFKAAMDGVMLCYEFAEPVETDISDALQSTYTVEAGGTEFVLVDEEQAAPQSAPVPFVFEYGLSAMDALADAVVRMSSAESAIVQNADNISMKVSQTDYNGQTVASLINQSPDEIKIQANHVQINGTTTFVSGDTISNLGEYLGNNYDAKGSAQTAVDNLELGGSNLLALLELYYSDYLTGASHTSGGITVTYEGNG